MSDLKITKDALVASLFELSKAAQDAAAATVDFYKSATTEEALAASLQNVSEASDAVTAAVTQVSPSVKRPAKALKAESTIGSAAENGTVEAPEKKKRKKVEKDPNAPKKPLTMYFAYSFFHRDKIREERKKNDLPPLSATEVTEIVKKQWESISDDEKTKWQQKYQDELKDYQLKKEAYHSAKSSEDLSKLPAPGATLPSQTALDNVASIAAAALPVDIEVPSSQPSAPETAVVEEETVVAETQSQPESSPIKESKKDKKRSKDEDGSSKKEKKSKKSKKDKSDKSDK
ncbi:HMG box domain-containing protein [[Candida] zeylanoides]